MLQLVVVPQLYFAVADDKYKYVIKDQKYPGPAERCILLRCNYFDPVVFSAADLRSGGGLKQCLEGF